MKVGAFDLCEPLPVLDSPLALVVLSPFVDVGNVGSSTLAMLETFFDAKEIGKLKRPGLFYDFTRYRPEMYSVGDQRTIELPNTVISYAQREEGDDLVFVHSLEPHMQGEAYIKSIFKVLERLDVRRYWAIGSRYDAVPHTRPLIVSGHSTEESKQTLLRQFGVERIEYEGPATIGALALEYAPLYGMETASLIVSLPYYAQFEDDYLGQYCLQSLLSSIFDIPAPTADAKRRGEDQYGQINQVVETDRQVRDMLRMLEIKYDFELRANWKIEAITSLSLDIETYLREINTDAH